MPSVPEIIENICKMCYIQNKMKQPERTGLLFVEIWLDEREENASREVSISSERRNSWLIEDVCC